METSFWECCRWGQGEVSVAQRLMTFALPWVGWTKPMDFWKAGPHGEGAEKALLYHPAVKGSCHSSCQGVSVRHTEDRQEGQEVGRRGRELSSATQNKLNLQISVWWEHRANLNDEYVLQLLNTLNMRQLMEVLAQCPWQSFVWLTSYIFILLGSTNLLLSWATVQRGR